VRSHGVRRDDPAALTEVRSDGELCEESSASDGEEKNKERRTIVRLVGLDPPGDKRKSLPLRLTKELEHPIADLEDLVSDVVGNGSQVVEDCLVTGLAETKELVVLTDDLVGDMSESHSIGREAGKTALEEQEREKRTWTPDLEKLRVNET
jgi:hypothetical protein